MGYWTKYVHRVFGSTEVFKVAEDWDKNTLQVTLLGSVDFPKDFKELGPEAQLRVWSEPDRRYEDRGEIGSYLVLHFTRVTFPSPPG